MRIWTAIALVSLGGTFGVMPCESRAAQAAPLTFADAADLAIQAPVVAHVRVVRASRLKPAEAAGIAPGHSRYYVEADVISLIRGAQGLPERISYLADLPNDASGRPAKLRKKSEHLIFADRRGTTGNEVRLVAADAQVAYSQAEADRVRSILHEATARDAAPRIAGIGRAFHVPGSLPGESETQIFLQAADGRPVSLSILRRPGEMPRWAVSLSEIVDESAMTPRPDTLLWYRLACSLPPSLPPQSLAEADPATAPAIQADYQLVKMSLGPCTRSRASR